MRKPQDRAFLGNGLATKVTGTSPRLGHLRFVKRKAYQNYFFVIIY